MADETKIEMTDAEKIEALQNVLKQLIFLGDTIFHLQGNKHALTYANAGRKVLEATGAKQ